MKFSVATPLLAVLLVLGNWIESTLAMSMKINPGAIPTNNWEQLRAQHAAEQESVFRELDEVLEHTQQLQRQHERQRHERLRYQIQQYSHSNLGQSGRITRSESAPSLLW